MKRYLMFLSLVLFSCEYQVASERDKEEPPFNSLMHTVTFNWNSYLNLAYVRKTLELEKYKVTIIIVISWEVFCLSHFLWLYLCFTSVNSTNLAN